VGRRRAGSARRGRATGDRNAPRRVRRTRRAAAGDTSGRGVASWVAYRRPAAHGNERAGKGQASNGCAGPWAAAARESWVSLQTIPARGLLARERGATSRYRPDEMAILMGTPPGAAPTSLLQSRGR